jgi:Uma2 family endonuclease
MSIVVQEVPALVQGDFLTRDEFLRRWKRSERIKRAELIGRIVYMPSPVSLEHGDTDHLIGVWLAHYEAATPFCRGSDNATWLMSADDAPQPDKSLRILPEYGGQSRREGEYAAGAPEFLAETCKSSAAYDLHQKFDLYEEAGVKEYLAVLMQEREVRWLHLVDGRFQIDAAPNDGIYRSVAFPGLWLDAAALLAGDLARVLAVLNEGIKSPEHGQFVERLRARLNQAGG